MTTKLIVNILVIGSVICMIVGFLYEVWRAKNRRDTHTDTVEPVRKITGINRMKETDNG